MTCLGDMCVPADTKTWSGTVPHAMQKGSPTADAEPPLKPACNRQVQPENRVLLLPVVDPYHGSTALEGLFMSSPHVTTLCANNVWQCEIRKYYKKVRNEDYFSATDVLNTSCEFWNLSQPILLDKGPRDFRRITFERHELGREIQAMLPRPMLSLGIKNLYYVYVFMWRPVCLSKLSSTARPLIEKDVSRLADGELHRLESMIRTHQYLSTDGAMTLVLSLADVLWEPDRTQRRLMEFLPCLATLDFSFRPTLGKDVLPGNKWKAETSVKQFGDSTDPWGCCGYAIREKSCRDDTNFFKALAPNLQTRANEALSYMLARS